MSSDTQIMFSKAHSLVPLSSLQTRLTVYCSMCVARLRLGGYLSTVAVIVPSDITLQLKREATGDQREENEPW